MSHEHHGISDCQQLGCLFNNLFKLETYETSKLRVTGHVWMRSTSDPWISLTKGQWCRKCFHVMITSWYHLCPFFCRKGAVVKRKLPLFCSLTTVVNWEGKTTYNGFGRNLNRWGKCCEKGACSEKEWQRLMYICLLVLIHSHDSQIPIGIAASGSRDW